MKGTERAEARVEPVIFDPVAVTQYGSPGRDVVLWCPHASDSAAFINALPEVVACTAPKALLERYLALEQDFGSGELAHAVARALAGGEAPLGITVVEARIPRGIIDLARVASRALRSVLRDRSHPVANVLLDLHRQATESIAAIVASLDPETGLFLDMHTMAPHTPLGLAVAPTEAVQETPDALEAYVAAYAPANRGARRMVDLITECAGVCVANEPLVDALATSLRAYGIPYRLNDPYPSAEHLIGAALMRRRHGITLDVPKDLLCREDVDSSYFDLARLTHRQDAAPRRSHRSRATASTVRDRR